MSHRKIILSITLLLSLTFAITSAAMTWNNSSKLNEGRWVKIKVNESGIHQITYEQLHELGFDNPDAVTTAETCCHTTPSSRPTPTICPS